MTDKVCLELGDDAGIRRSLQMLLDCQAQLNSTRVQHQQNQPAKLDNSPRYKASKLVVASVLHFSQMDLRLALQPLFLAELQASCCFS